jgi:hypothetical protein
MRRVQDGIRRQWPGEFIAGQEVITPPDKEGVAKIGVVIGIEPDNEPDGYVPVQVAGCAASTFMRPDQLSRACL